MEGFDFYRGQKAEWLEDLIGKYKSGICNTFVLHGNIGDYPAPGILLMDYLMIGLNELEFEDVCIYNQANPIEVLKGNINISKSEWMFDELCGLITDNKTKKAIIIEYPEFIVPNIPVSQMQEYVQNRFIMLHKAINSSQFMNSNNIVIFMCEAQSEINQRFINSNTRSHIIGISYPNEQERLDEINYLISTSDVKLKYELSVEQLAKLTAGLTRVNIEDIFLQAEQTGVLEKQLIVERKRELIQKEYASVIEILDADGYTFADYAGQEHLKSYHREVIIEPILNGETSIVPKGVLYSGPPGTGKTHFARCLAGEANINFVEFKISKILDMWVGEAEKKFEKALTCFKSIAPVGVFIDEIDQVFSRGDNSGNSVQKNLFGMFLSVLSDPSNRGKILFIGATNYPNKLDEALKRTGRFDKKIPFLPPTKEERVEMFKLQLSKCGYPYKLDNYDETLIADKTDMYTQAEIEGVVVKALEVVKRRKMACIDYEVLNFAVDNVVSFKNEKIKEMTDIAIAECNDMEFLPNKYKEEKAKSCNVNSRRTAR